MLHDAIFVLGVFAVLGHFLDVEVDALFITALLTIIGFSVHDTIVVFDRIRENLKGGTDDSFEEIVNYSIGQTLVRSVNTSITVIITLLALLLFGGSTTREFVLALLIGVAVGTYSSIFNAAQLLVAWENGEIQALVRRVTRTRQSGEDTPEATRA
jgi:preprotein translocase subunit SecF